MEGGARAKAEAGEARAEMKEGEARVEAEAGEARAEMKEGEARVELPSARMQTHSGVKGGRSHGGVLPGNTRETTD